MNNNRRYYGQSDKWSGWLSIILGVLFLIGSIIVYNEATAKVFGYVYHDDMMVFFYFLLIFGILSLILGVFGIIYGKRIEKQDEKYINDIKNSIKCIKCGYISAGAEKFCQRCGNDLVAQISEKNRINK